MQKERGEGVNYSQNSVAVSPIRRVYSTPDDGGAGDVRLAALPLDLRGDDLGELEKLVVARHAVVVGHADGDDGLLKVARSPGGGLPVAVVAPSGGAEVGPGRSQLEDRAGVLRPLSAQWAPLRMSLTKVNFLSFQTYAQHLTIDISSHEHSSLGSPVSP